MAVCAAHSPVPTFESYLPTIQTKLRCRFRHLNQDAAEDAVAEGTAIAYSAYRRAAEAGRPMAADDDQNRTGKITAGTLARFATLAFDEGRRFGGTSIVDVFAPGTRAAGRAHVIGFEDFGEREHEQWADHLVTRREADPHDKVRCRIDWRAIADRCSIQQRRVLGMIAEGYGGSEIAKHIGVSPARVCQIKGQIAAVAARLGYEPSWARTTA